MVCHINKCLIGLESRLARQSAVKGVVSSLLCAIIRTITIMEPRSYSLIITISKRIDSLVSVLGVLKVRILF